MLHVYTEQCSNVTIASKYINTCIQSTDGARQCYMQGCPQYDASRTLR